MTLGVAGVPTYGLSIKDVVVLGNLTFITDITYHSLKHYFSGCEFQGSITFPTATSTSGYSITFEDFHLRVLLLSHSIILRITFILHDVISMGRLSQIILTLRIDHGWHSEIVGTYLHYH